MGFFIVRPSGVSGPAMRDFEAFYAAGATANAGADPYGRAIWQAERAIPGVDTSHDETLPFVGPPAELPLWRALALLPFSVAGRVWGAMLACTMLLTVFGTLALIRAPEEATIVLGAAIFAGSFGALISDVALGQIALFSTAAVVATLLLLRSRAWPVAALTSTLAAFQPNLCIVMIARATDLRALAAFGCGAIVFFGLMISAGGFDALGHYVHLLGVHGEAEKHTVIQITPASVALGFGAPDAVIAFVGYASLLVALVLGALAIFRIRDPIARVGIAVCVLPFVVPFFHEHDFVLLILPALYCAIHARGSTLAFSALAATLCGVDWLGLGQRPNAEVQSVVLATACALGFALLAQMRRAAFAGLIVPLVVVAVSLFARVHPVPIWPDALPLHWQGPANASVSALWGLEQRAAGLDTQDPVWAFLRLLSLVADALIGFALYRCLLDVDVHEIVERREGIGVKAL
ncbi:MAG TPA: glycosyltransferase family 87 protein [Candidatus Baltobacteraceae bacterium]